jgi:hypothetical protein
VTDGIPAFGGLRLPDGRPETPGGGRELFVRYARKEGRTVAILRGVDQGGSCVVEAEVFPQGAAGEPRRAGPYTFADVHQANEFVADALEALMVLGCAPASR